MLVFSCDHASVTGNDHLSKGDIGQDYALSRRGEMIGCAVVADGCSTGGKTDLGARFACLGVMSLLQLNGSGRFSSSYNSMRSSIRLLMESQTSFMGLEANDMYATCLCVRVDEDVARVFVYGDGLVVAQYKDDGKIAYKFEWSNNMPEYPVYGEPEQKILLGNGAKLTRTAYEADPGKTDFNQFDLVTVPLLEAPSVSSFAFETKELANIAVFTDGVFQIHNGVDEYPWRNAVLELLAFKNMTGVFAKRRMKAFVAKLRAAGFKPEDDLSYSVVHCEEVSSGG